MKTLQPILTASRPPGIYRLRSRARASSIQKAFTESGWRSFFIDGLFVDDKASFLHTAAAALRFPRYFGRNWDAFEECITDLEWAPAKKGYVILYDDVVHFARHAPQDWRTARAILHDAVTDWARQDKAFYVLLRRTWWYARDIPRLAGPP